MNASSPDDLGFPQRPADTSHPTAATSPFSRQLLDLVSDLVWAVSPDGRRMLFWNRAAEAVYGTSSDRLAQRDFLWLGVVHPEDKPLILSHLEQLDRDSIAEQEFRVLRDDGSECWLQARFRRVCDSQGATQYIGILAKDITQRILAEQQLDESRAIYESLVQSFPIRVFRKNRQGRLVFCNQTYCETLGRPLEELIGKTDEDLFDAELAASYLRDDHQVLTTGAPLHKIEKHPGANGELTFVEVIKVPMKDGRGNRVGIQGIFWDVTERMRVQQSLEKAKEIAESASRAKSDFLASVSHEIRTPMNAIIGMTELLMDAVSDRQHREYLQMIHQSSETLLDLINDLLDFSKIEAGKLELEDSAFELVDMLADSARALALRAHQKKIEMIVELVLPPRVSLFGDGPRLRQVLSNLLSNAIKFTHRGHVWLQVTVVDESATELTLKFTVQDTGIGIAADKLEIIFQEFEQADKSTTREYGGTGLGLAISSKIVEMMGGKLQVSSELGVGSCFWFQLTFPKSAGEVRGAPPFAGKSAWVIEEHPVAREVLSAQLRRWGLEVTPFSQIPSLASLGELGVDTPVPSLVCVNITRDPTLVADWLDEVRMQSAWSQCYWLVMSAGQPHPAEWEEAGIERLLKPIKPSDLWERLSHRWQSSTQKTSSAASIHKLATAQSLQILLAEDNRINQRLAQAILENLGHRVSLAENGEQAIELFRTASFDLVLMDVQMPKIDGLEATRTMREWEGTDDHTPIVALSAHTYQGFREQCLMAGMDEYLAKPLRRQALIETVERLTGHRPVTVRAQQRRSVQRVVDWRQAFETVGGDRQLLQEIVGVFLQESPKMLHDISQALGDRNFREIRRTAHGLKGALNYLGANQAMKLAMRIETSPESTDPAELQNCLQELRLAIDELTGELHKFKHRTGDQ